MTADGISFDGAPTEALSAIGAARRDTMLRELDAAMRRRNFARVATRASVAAVPLFALAFAIGFWPRGSAVPPAPRGNAVALSAGQNPVPGLSQYTFIQLVDTDPTITERLAASPISVQVTPISDAELQSLLASLGRPTGFVRTGGRVILINDLRPPAREPERAPADPDPRSSI